MAVHRVVLGDAREMGFLADASIHLVVTSPPYFNLKRYVAGDRQLGNWSDYDDFLDELDRVWRHCFRALVPGGRICCVVGDVCVARREAGRHYVLPLAADIQVRCRRIGFDNLTPIIWHKVANISLEASNSSRFLGKPNLPNGVIKNDREHILMLRKPGGYRKPTPEMEAASRIGNEDYFRRFQPIWSDVTGQIRVNHPAPFPLREAPGQVGFDAFATVVIDTDNRQGATLITAVPAPPEGGAHHYATFIARIARLYVVRFGN